jgi:hypothetical protein
VGEDGATIQLFRLDAAPPFGGRLPVDVATMADPDDHNNQFTVLNLVQDAIVPLPKSELAPPGELLATGRPRVAPQRRDLLDDPWPVLPWERLDLPGG